MQHSRSWIQVIIPCLCCPKIDMNSSVFYDVTVWNGSQVIDVSGKPTGPIFKGQAGTAWPLMVGQTGCCEMLITTNLHCVTSQNSEDLIYTAAEAWNQAKWICWFILLHLSDKCLNFADCSIISTDCKQYYLYGAIL